MASVTIMASVTYGKCNLWQVLLMASVIMASVTYGKCNLLQVLLMANLLW